MKTYTRKQINSDSSRFKETKFITFHDANEMLVRFAELAIKHGADKNKLFEGLNNEINNNNN